MNARVSKGVGECGAWGCGWSQPKPMLNASEMLMRRFWVGCVWVSGRIQLLSGFVRFGGGGVEMAIAAMSSSS